METRALLGRNVSSSAQTVGMTDQSEPSCTLALEEARRGFDQLAGEVTAIRDRAVTTLGMGGLAASFLGGVASVSRTPAMIVSVACGSLADAPITCISEGTAQ